MSIERRISALEAVSGTSTVDLRRVCDLLADHHGLDTDEVYGEALAFLE